MVLPFLGIYLKSSLGFTLEQTGVVLSCFGIGSMAGSFLGGWLTDRFGNFHVQFISLLLGGIIFLVLANVTAYIQLAFGILLLVVKLLLMFLSLKWGIFSAEKLVLFRQRVYHSFLTSSFRVICLS